jgi:hypothetical protein
MKAQRTSALYFKLSATEEWLVNDTPRPCYPRERKTVVTVQDDGWKPIPICTLAENLTIIGIRSPDRPDRSESLYRLSCPSSLKSRLNGSLCRTLA